MVKCSECGYENMDGLDYCDGCGAKLEASVAQQTAAPASAATGSPGPAPEPATVTETAPAGAAAESPTTPVSAAESTAVSAPPAAGEEPSAAKAPTGEMRAGAAPAAVAAPPFKAKLAIIRGVPQEQRGHEFELELGNNLVGRWDPETGAFPEVDMEQFDPEAKISRKHALIRIEGNRVTIEDIGSLNGTYVNRQPRLQPGNPLDLKDGDEIIIGKTFLKLSISPVS